MSAPGLLRQSSSRFTKHKEYRDIDNFCAVIGDSCKEEKKALLESFQIPNSESRQILKCPDLENV